MMIALFLVVLLYLFLSFIRKKTYYKIDAFYSVKIKADV
ncbi:hypothetical protein A5880_002834 [Enterococcus sp. 4G2_DIV0659]|uniref:Uncharacterized protein n=1 Tax=Candidatus Enterococcus mansonii TaxID=1834181 RepID=A0A242CIU7_9ENTE|nr:hypothetical protein A5880_000731 [Enterococcus sp. 4G2_DIV0659]